MLGSFLVMCYTTVSQKKERNQMCYELSKIEVQHWAHEAKILV